MGGCVERASDASWLLLRPQHTDNCAGAGVCQSPNASACGRAPAALKEDGRDHSKRGMPYIQGRKSALRDRMEEGDCPTSRVLFDQPSSMTCTPRASRKLQMSEGWRNGGSVWGRSAGVAGRSDSSSKTPVDLRYNNTSHSRSLALPFDLLSRSLSHYSTRYTISQGNVHHSQRRLTAGAQRNRPDPMTTHAHTL